MNTSLAQTLRGQPDMLWTQLQKDAAEIRAHEPKLAPLIGPCVIERKNISDALAYLLSEELGTKHISSTQLRAMIAESHAANPEIAIAAQHDLLAIIERDPAAPNVLVPFLFFKGFHALQIYRVAHWLWQQGEKTTAAWLQSHVARKLAVDIHPAAKIGKGILMDHAHGIVIGETAVVEDNVSMVHDVTLGGTGKDIGDRHPKVRSGVMIGAGAIILGNIEVGVGARVAAGSVVLHPVAAHKTVAGVPAKVVGEAGCASPAEEMDQMLEAGSSI